MTTVFTNVGEFRRGKGNRKTRLGPRITVETTTRRGVGEKQHQTPDDIALKKLLKLLEKPGLSLKDRYDYIALMRNAEQIRFMNMPVLAEVLLFKHNVGNNVTQENFNYNAIRPYIDRLLPHKEVAEGGIRAKELSEEDLEIMRLRMAATFLRYIRYVSFLQERAVEALTLAQAEQTPGMFPAVDEF